MAQAQETPVPRDGRSSGGGLFYGWRIVFASAVGLMLGATTLPLYTLGVFIRPLSAEFHWQVPQITFASVLFIHLSVIVVPFAGWVVDRGNARLVIAVSAALGGLAMACLYFLSDSLTLFYGLYLVVAVAGCCTTPVAFAKVVSRWFDRRRGLALGVLMAGVGLGGAVLPLLTNQLIEAYGWRTAYLILGLLMIVVEAPIVLLLLRNHPADMGMRPDGDSAPAVQAAPAAGSRPAEAGVTLTQALRTRTFWALLTAFALLGGAFGSLAIQMVPILTRHGLTPGAAALTFSTMGLANIAGRMVVGFLLDRVYPTWLGMLIWIPGALALVVLGHGASPAVLFALVILIGFALGSEVDILAYLTGRYFGLKSFGRIYAVLFSVFTLGSSWGVLLIGRLLSIGGDYVLPMNVLGGAVVLGCLILLTMKRYRPGADQQVA